VQGKAKQSKAKQSKTPSGLEFSYSADNHSEGNGKQWRNTIYSSRPNLQCREYPHNSIQNNLVGALPFGTNQYRHFLFLNFVRLYCVLGVWQLTG
jgi:hypothetical protein